MALRPTFDVDHVTMARRDLDGVVTEFEELGLAPDYGGEHGHRPTHMALLGFPDGSYVELISTVPEADPADAGPWADYVAADAGPCAWCVGVDDPAAAAKAAIDAGVPVDGPRHASRERDDGALVEWDMAFVGDGQFLPFVIADRTPREDRVTTSESVAGGPLTGIETVVLGVDDREAAADRFASVYHCPRPRPLDTGLGAAVASVPGTPVAFAEPTDDGPFAERVASLGPGPVAYLLGTTDLDDARDRYALGPVEPWGERSAAWADVDGLRDVLGVVEIG
jgi:hypothetical protein